MAICYICNKESYTYKCPECGSMIFKDEIHIPVHSKLDSGTIYVSDKKIMICYLGKFNPSVKQGLLFAIRYYIFGILFASMFDSERRKRGDTEAKRIVMDISDIKSFVFPYNVKKHTDLLCIKTKRNRFAFGVKDKNNMTKLIDLLSKHNINKEVR